MVNDDVIDVQGHGHLYAPIDYGEVEMVMEISKAQKDVIKRVGHNVCVGHKMQEVVGTRNVQICQ